MYHDRQLLALLVLTLLWAAGPRGNMCVAADEPMPPALWIARNRMAHESGVGAVAFSPDGKTLVSGSGDGTIKLWEVATGKQVFAITLQ